MSSLPRWPSCFYANIRSTRWTLKTDLPKYNEANIRFNATKTQLCANQVNYLGYSFDKSGVRINEERAKIIHDWPTPTNCSQVRTILGTSNYFRKFVPRYSQFTAPLRALTLNGATFKWGVEEQQCSDKLKEILTSDTILVYPRFDDIKNYPFILVCDGAKSGYGDCLML